MTLDQLLWEIATLTHVPSVIEVPVEDFERLGNEVAAESHTGVWLSAPIDRQNFICRGIPCVPKVQTICGEMEDGA